jgi:hypothetical protein
MRRSGLDLMFATGGLPVPVDPSNDQRASAPPSDPERLSQPFGHRLRLRDYFSLRPYGQSLVTPAVSAWVLSAWIIILLMASIEGFVWGAVGFSLVPAASPWLAPPVAAFLFALMFSIIWIVDSSLIMSERPPLRRRAPGMKPTEGRGPLVRWTVGILVRVAIVAISLYVTAPFIEKLIRADDIEAYHQAQVEQYFKDRDAAIQAQVRARAEQVDAGLAGRIASLEAEIARLSKSLEGEQARRARIEAEYAPEIEVVSRDLAAARARVGDEVLGRDGRVEGYGPQARKWDSRAELLADQLAAIQAERDARLADIEPTIKALQGRLAERSDALRQVRQEQQEVLARLTAEVTAQQPPAAPPKLTFAARSKALSTLRQSPEEAGVPHFESVSGFAQAALGILFFALIALKLFEPPAVRAYFSESVQLAYQRYLAGGLVGVPGFAHHDDPTRRLSPIQFAHQWQRYEEDPSTYFELVQAVSTAEARLQRLLADQAYELELLERQRQDIDQRLELERHRREVDLRLREQELALKLEEARRRHDRETQLEIEALEHKRQEARRAHELALERLEHELAHERTKLDEELQRRSAEWAQQRAIEEEELVQRRKAFAEAQRSAESELELRRMAQEEEHRLRELELQQSAAEKERQDARASRESLIEKTRALLQEERERHAEQQAKLTKRRGEAAKLNAAVAEAEAKMTRLVERVTALQERIGAERARLDEEAAAPQPSRSLWGSDPARAVRREAERRLKRLEQERQALTKERDALGNRLAAQHAERDAEQHSLATLESETSAGASRIDQYRERLDSLLLERSG